MKRRDVAPEDAYPFTWRDFTDPPPGERADDENRMVNRQIHAVYRNGAALREWNAGRRDVARAMQAAKHSAANCPSCVVVNEVRRRDKLPPLSVEVSA